MSILILLIVNVVFSIATFRPLRIVCTGLVFFNCVAISSLLSNGIPDRILGCVFIAGGIFVSFVTYGMGIDYLEKGELHDDAKKALSKEWHKNAYETDGFTIVNENLYSSKLTRGKVISGIVHALCIVFAVVMAQAGLTSGIPLLSGIPVGVFIAITVIIWVICLYPSASFLHNYDIAPSKRISFLLSVVGGLLMALSAGTNAENNASWGKLFVAGCFFMVVGLGFTFIMKLDVWDFLRGAIMLVVFVMMPVIYPENEAILSVMLIILAASVGVSVIGSNKKQIETEKRRRNARKTEPLIQEDIPSAGESIVGRHFVFDNDQFSDVFTVETQDGTGVVLKGARGNQISGNYSGGRIHERLSGSCCRTEKCLCPE